MEGSRTQRDTQIDSWSLIHCNGLELIFWLFQCIGMQHFNYIFFHNVLALFLPPVEGEGLRRRPLAFRGRRTILDMERVILLDLAFARPDGYVGAVDGREEGRLRR